MLRSLRVQDLATIADVTLDLGPGLNVLTGETGAGKSMLVDALALLLGDRADRAAVRPGASRLVIDGEFTELPDAVEQAMAELGLEAEDSLIVRREVSKEGRSRAWINGSPATVGSLAGLGRLLIDLHGQHQTAALNSPIVQQELLDGYAGCQAELAEVASTHSTACGAEQRLADLESRRDEVSKRADWLRHLVTEIDRAGLVIGEDESIKLESSRLAQAGSLAEQARQVSELLDGEGEGIAPIIARLSRAVDTLIRLDPSVSEWRELLDGAWAGLDELSRKSTDYSESMVDDPDRLSQLERRRGEIGELTRKHGPSIADVLDVRRTAAAELDLLDTAGLDLRQLAAAADDAKAVLAIAAGKLTELRKAASVKLSGEVNRLLPTLALKGAEFSVELLNRGSIGSGGGESVRFMARLNEGMMVQDIAKSASGGELSRLMLALKVVVARHDKAPTLIFDEIDQGIGGEVGVQVGKALEQVSGKHQVLVITHLPQIAARADHHLKISKGTQAGIATSDVARMLGEDRMLEIARMLGDVEDSHARRLAMSMLGDRAAN